MFFASLLLAAGEEAPPPLIDIDLTVVVQFLFFVVMWIVLWRFLFAPYLKMRDARAEGIEGARHKAKEMEAKAREIVAEYDAGLNRAKLRGADERNKLRSEAAVYERQVLGAARDEAQRALAEARTRIASQTETARRGLEAQAATLAKSLAKKIMGREVA
jgi:F-type H+-transporting ATPase subunit b